MFVNLNDCFETIFGQIDVIPSKILISIVFVMGYFTLRLPTQEKKMILQNKCVLSICLGQREKTNSALPNS